jgi:hypothetical protein
MRPPEDECVGPHETGSHGDVNVQQVIHANAVDAVGHDPDLERVADLKVGTT